MPKMTKAQHAKLAKLKTALDAANDAVYAVAHPRRDVRWTHCYEMAPKTVRDAYDFTPTGKRTVRQVQTDRGYQIRGYVSGRRYGIFGTVHAALKWRDNTEGLLPQPREAIGL